MGTKEKRKLIENVEIRSNEKKTYDSQKKEIWKEEKRKERKNKITE